MTKLLTIYIGVAAALFLNWPAVYAQTSSSSNYRFIEPAIGGSGLIESQSTNFQAAASSGILGLDTSIGTDFQVQAGNLTSGEPALSFAIIDSTIDFGAFSPGLAATATSTFEVTNYTSFGYVVQILGTPPTYRTHTIDSMASSGPSQVGIEQFGINLVANTSPVSLGANPDNIDASSGHQFGFGEAAANYNSPDNYRYVSGETVALAPKSSGKTVYTISYIVNVTSLTPGGQYTGNQVLVCTGTY